MKKDKEELKVTVECCKNCRDCHCVGGAYVCGMFSRPTHPYSVCGWFSNKNRGQENED